MGTDKYRYREQILTKLDPSQREQFQDCMDHFDGQGGNLSSRLSGQSFSNSSANSNDCTQMLKNFGLTDDEIDRCIDY